MNLREEINQKAQEIDNILERYLPREEGYQTTVFEAMNYSVRAGGKRLRPMLMQETYRRFGGGALYGSHRDDSHLLPGTRRSAGHGQ